MQEWEKAHKVVERIKSVNLSKDSLERALGVVLYRLVKGGKNLTDINAAADLMLALRQENGIEDFLKILKETENECIASQGE